MKNKRLKSKKKKKNALNLFKLLKHFFFFFGFSHHTVTKQLFWSITTTAEHYLGVGVLGVTS